MSEKKHDSYDYLMHSAPASSSDQTGLIPTAIHSEEEKESYENLYPYPPPVVKQDDGQQAKNSMQTGEKS